jgi:hypothetical protein
MKSIFEILLPAKADNTIRGWKFPLYIFILIAVISTVRSFIHLLSPDGGAGSIAGWICRWLAQAKSFLRLHYGVVHNC